MRSSAGTKVLANVSICGKIAVEGGALAAVQGAFRIGRFSGYVMSKFVSSDITEIAPTRLKKLVSGYGASNKEYVKKKDLEKLGLSEDFSMCEDEGDALALLCCLIKPDEMPPLVLPKKRKTRKKAIKTQKSPKKGDSC